MKDTISAYNYLRMPSPQSRAVCLTNALGYNPQLLLTDQRSEYAKWYDYVIRFATPHGLQRECTDAYGDYIRNGDIPAQAANAALNDWDI